LTWCLFGSVFTNSVVDEFKCYVANGQFVPWSDVGRVNDTVTVNPHAIHAVQVADDEAVVDQSQTTVLAGDLGTFLDDDVTVWVPTDQHDRLVDHNRSSALFGFE
jgi:hypothetical protein